MPLSVSVILGAVRKRNTGKNEAEKAGFVASVTQCGAPSCLNILCLSSESCTGLQSHVQVLTVQE